MTFSQDTCWVYGIRIVLMWTKDTALLIDFPLYSSRPHPIHHIFEVPSPVPALSLYLPTSLCMDRPKVCEILNEPMVVDVVDPIGCSCAGLEVVEVAGSRNRRWNGQ